MRLTILFLIVAVTVGCLMMGCKPKEEPAPTPAITKTGPGAAGPGKMAPPKGPGIETKAPGDDDAKLGDEPADDDAKLGDEPGDDDAKPGDEPGDDDAKLGDDDKAPDVGPADVKAPPAAKKTGP